MVSICCYGRKPVLIRHGTAMNGCSIQLKTRLTLYLLSLHRILQVGGLMRLHRYLLLVLSAPALAQPQYTVTDLGSLQWATEQPKPGTVPGTTEYDKTSAGEVGVDSMPDASSGGFTNHAYLYKQGKLTDLGVLPGAMGYTERPGSAALGINSAAHVVGVSASAFYNTDNSGKAAAHAVLWNGGTIDLGTISGDPGNSSMAEAINDSEEVVGYSQVTLTTGQLAQRAFVWAAGKMYNLTMLLVSAPNLRLTDQLQINCQGAISALGYNAADLTRRAHSCLLTRVGTARTCP